MTEAELRAALSGLSGLTLWPCPKGWQASTRKAGSDGWSIAIDADPAVAVLRALGLYAIAPDNEDVFA